MALYSTVFCYPKILKKDSHNPQGLRLRFGLFRFRSSLTNGITIVFFSSSYIRYFSSEGVHPDKSGLLCLRKAEFPHSEIAGSKPVWQLPDAIGAYTVLLRPVFPRHPPFALLKQLSDIP